MLLQGLAGRRGLPAEGKAWDASPGVLPPVVHPNSLAAPQESCGELQLPAVPKGSGHAEGFCDPLALFPRCSWIPRAPSWPRAAPIKASPSSTSTRESAWPRCSGTQVAFLALAWLKIWQFAFDEKNLGKIFGNPARFGCPLAPTGQQNTERVGRRSERARWEMAGVWGTN